MKVGDGAGLLELLRLFRLGLPGSGLGAPGCSAGMGVRRGRGACSHPHSGPGCMPSSWTLSGPNLYGVRAPGREVGARWGWGPGSLRTRRGRGVGAGAPPRGGDPAWAGSRRRGGGGGIGPASTWMYQRKAASRVCVYVRVCMYVRACVHVFACDGAWGALGKRLFCHFQGQLPNSVAPSSLFDGTASSSFRESLYGEVC